jgi:hypothetical protein
MRLRRIIGTLMALAAGWLIWSASARVEDFLELPDLLPLVRLGAVVAGVAVLEHVFVALQPLLSERSDKADNGGLGE